MSIYLSARRLACFWVLLAGTFAMAQTTSRVTGLVRDSSGAVVSGAEVRLTHETTGVAFDPLQLRPEPIYLTPCSQEVTG